jgi:hypothetical protein
MNSIKEVEKLIVEFRKALEKHVKYPSDAYTEIFNRAYEAVADALKFNGKECDELRKNQVVWHRVEDVLPISSISDILIWVKNLSDIKSSRFQRASYCKVDNKKSLFTAYPLVYKEDYHQSLEFEGSDLEGDKVKVIAWAELPKYKNDSPKEE